MDFLPLLSYGGGRGHVIVVAVIELPGRRGERFVRKEVPDFNKQTPFRASISVLRHACVPKQVISLNTLFTRLPIVHMSYLPIFLTFVWTKTNARCAFNCI